MADCKQSDSKISANKTEESKIEKESSETNDLVTAATSGASATSSLVTQEDQQEVTNNKQEKEKEEEGEEVNVDDDTAHGEQASASKVNHSDSDTDSDCSNEDMDPRKASLLRKLSTYLAGSLHIKDETAPRLRELSPIALAEYIKSENCKSVIAMIGAGMSTSG